MTDKTLAEVDAEVTAVATRVSALESKPASAGGADSRLDEILDAMKHGMFGSAAIALEKKIRPPKAATTPVVAVKKIA